MIKQKRVEVDSPVKAPTPVRTKKGRQIIESDSEEEDENQPPTEENIKSEDEVQTPGKDIQPKQNGISSDVDSKNGQQMATPEPKIEVRREKV